MSLDELLAAERRAVLEPVLAEIRQLRTEVAELRAVKPSRLLTVAEAAAELRISACTVRRRIADGSLPSRRLGGRVLVDLSPAAVEGKECD